MKGIWRILINKYVLTLVAFAIWMVFLDSNSYLIQRELDTEIEELDAGIAFYEQDISWQVRRLKEVENNPEVLERFARETYWMHRPGEEVVLVAPAKKTD
jgi:cell division protein FtsB